MLRQGYRQVGKDFPVFLHPQTQEEYALARSDRRDNIAYPQAHPGVTLEQDLARRDLTINAIAQRPDGTLVDPYGGEQDIRDRVLRHVSPAFAQDPVRVLRLCRFLAQFAHWGFSVAQETQELMRALVASGALDNLVPERVWAEVLKSLSSDAPQVFFTAMRSCGALARVLPEIDCLWGVPQPERWHPEVDTGIHTMMVLQRATQLTPKPEVRFAALTHDLGKGVTSPEVWPSHHGHEGRGAEIIHGLAARLRLPNRFLRLAERVARFHGQCHKVDELRPATLLKLLESVQAFRDPDGFTDLLLACEADFCGRKGFETREYPQAGLLMRCFQRAGSVDTAPLKAYSDGRQAALALHQLRLDAIKAELGQVGSTR
jgi:tRNA nucleotidyltransferase (CCA-adding enzyme)